MEIEESNDNACLGDQWVSWWEEEKVRRTGVSEKGKSEADLQESGFLAEKAHD